MKQKTRYTDDLQLAFNPESVHSWERPDEKGVMLSVRSSDGVDLVNANTDYDYRMVSAQPDDKGGVIAYLVPEEEE